MRDSIAVLVVDDEALIRMDVVEQLENEGFQVFEATNADEAIRLLDENPTIHLLFTDIEMPGSMDGLKLAAAVRKRWPPVKIVITSGLRLLEAADMPEGSAFFSKPYRHGPVMKMFREMLSI